MPKARVYLSEEGKEELRRLADDDIEPSDENSIEGDEYLELRDRAIAKAEAAGDDELADRLLEDYPHPDKLEADERAEQARRLAEEERESRRPQSDEDRVAFLRALDDTPDGDKDALRETLNRHGMLHVEEGEIA